MGGIFFRICRDYNRFLTAFSHCFLRPRLPTMPGLYFRRKKSPSGECLQLLES